MRYSSVGRGFRVAFTSARLQRRNLDIATRSNRTRRVLVLERIEGCAHHVVRIGRAERFRNDVLHAQRLEDRAHRTAGNDTRAGRRRTEEHLARAVTPEDVVVQCAAFAQRNARQAPPCSVSRLADRFRNLACLAVTEANPAFLVTHYDQCSETETAAALDHLRDAIDVHQLVRELAVTLFTVAAAALTI